MELDSEDVQHLWQDHRPLSLREFAESTSAIEAAGFNPDVFFLVAKDFKQRVRYFGNVLVQMALREPFQKDDRLMVEIRVLTQALSYLLNSSSFEDGKLHDFDKKEIDRKLSREEE